MLMREKMKAEVPFFTLLMLFKIGNPHQYQFHNIIYTTAHAMLLFEGIK